MTYKEQELANIERIKNDCIRAREMNIPLIIKTKYAGTLQVILEKYIYEVQDDK